MAENIVQSMFGPTPFQIQQAQQAQIGQAASNYAQLDPLQRAAQSMYQGGAGLGQLGAGMLGMVNPQVEEARQREAAFSGIDINDPQSLLQRAQQIQDPRLKLQLQMLAQQRQAEIQENALKRAQELAALRKAQEESSPLAKLTPKDYTPESWTEFVSTGMKDTSKLRAIVETGKEPSAVQEYLFAKKQGYTGTFEQWKNQQKPAGVIVKIPEQEKEFEKELGKGQAKSIIESRTAADDAVEIINTVNVGKNILKKGVITGFGANTIVNIGQALKQAGIDFGGDAIANTQAYTANMAQNVGKLIKQFGAGTGLSDADREYATKMAGGLITIDKKAIEEILRINEKAATNIINLHNKRVKGIKSNIPLEVQRPVEQEIQPKKSTQPKKWNATKGKWE